MKTLFLAALITAIALPAVAQAPAPEKTTPVEMSLLDAQVAAVAIVNAGAACDAGVKVMCQLVAVREGTLAKIQAAAAKLQAPVVPAPK